MPKVLDSKLKCKARKLKNELRKEPAQLTGSVTEPEEEKILATLNQSSAIIGHRGAAFAPIELLSFSLGRVSE